METQTRASDLMLSRSDRCRRLVTVKRQRFTSAAALVFRCMVRLSCVPTRLFIHAEPKTLLLLKSVVSAHAPPNNSYSILRVFVPSGGKKEIFPLKASHTMPRKNSPTIERIHTREVYSRSKSDLYLKYPNFVLTEKCNLKFENDRKILEKIG